MNELSLLFFAHYFSRLSPCYYCSLFFNDQRQTCLRDGKTLKVVLCTKFCPACDKQVIASALVQLGINFTCIFKVFQIALVASRLGQFCENLKILVKLILNYPRVHAITYTNRTIFCSKSHLFSRPMRMAQKNKTTNQISRLFFKLTNHITEK